MDLQLCLPCCFLCELSSLCWPLEDVAICNLTSVSSRLSNTFDSREHLNDCFPGWLFLLLLFAPMPHRGQGWIPNNTLCDLTTPYPQLLREHHISRTQFGYLEGVELSLASSQNYFLFTGEIECYYPQGFSYKTTSFPASPHHAFGVLQTSCLHLQIHYPQKR